MNRNSACEPADPEDPIDSSVLEGYHFLRSVSGRDMLSGFIDEFLEDLPRRLQAIAMAVEGADASGLITSAHRLRSSAAEIGARTLAGLAGDLEVAARRGSLSAAMSLYQRLEEAAHRTRLALQGLRAA